jgi:hypothetical protein
MPLLFIYFYIIYLSFIACSGSMREASCGSMIPAINIYLLVFIYYSVPHTAARTAAHCCTAKQALPHCHTLPSTPPYTVAHKQ